MLKGGTIDIVVGRVAIDEAVEKEGVDGIAPVVGGRHVLMIGPRNGGIFEGVESILVGVEIPRDQGFFVRPGGRSGGQEGDASGEDDAWQLPHHGERATRDADNELCTRHVPASAEDEGKDGGEIGRERKTWRETQGLTIKMVYPKKAASRIGEWIRRGRINEVDN
jgi:hypothetical protein